VKEPVPDFVEDGFSRRLPDDLQMSLLDERLQRQVDPARFLEQALRRLIEPEV
jgi:hypothetical protein